MSNTAALISGLLSNLAPLIKDEFSLLWNFKKVVEKISSTLSSISSVLEDAEMKAVQGKDKQSEDWLRKLKDVLYEVRDIVEECTFEHLRLQVKSSNASPTTRVTNSITHPLRNICMNLINGHKIKDVQEKLDQKSSEREKLHLRESNHDCQSIPNSKIAKFSSIWRETLSHSRKQVYGRDEDKKKIIDILLNNTSNACASKNLSVLPIWGIGGIGKTTLAQTVFKDQEIVTHFKPIIWVSVSHEFDIETIMKEIIAKKENFSETLLSDVKVKLSGKKYLIVLDDVWNDNVEAWDRLRSILDCGSEGAFILTTTRKRNVATIMKTNKTFELSSLSENDCWQLFEQRAFLPETPKTQNLIDIGKEIAKKCKGVPLVAKILGSQLGFTSDENEWGRIKDSEIWEIWELSEEGDLMHILKLSYYDLPYYLRRCFAFCAVFPQDTEIEKEKLIQLWKAHGLIPTVKKQRVEDVGNKIWNELCWRSFFQDEKEKKDYVYDKVYTTCMMHDLLHELAQFVMQEECYTMDAKSSNDGLGGQIRHVTVKVNELNKTSVCSLKTIKGLQSIMLHGRDEGKAAEEILSVLKKLPALRVLQVCFLVQCQYLSNVGSLKHLRYLDFSHSKITALPNSICDLFNLETLKLNECSELESLPRNTWDLINLRHLYLEGCKGLKYMPRGMGKLKHLKMLSLFVISKGIDDGQIDELKELDICGSLIIEKLGNVSEASIARGISTLGKKWSITNLELNWGYTSDEISTWRRKMMMSMWKGDNEVKVLDDNEVKVLDDVDVERHEKISKALEVSTANLKKLRMSGYKGVNPPNWVGKSSPSPTRLKSNGDKEVTVLFPLLEELRIFRMKNLSELVSPSCWSICTEAFPNLRHLHISNCPQLGALPPHLKAVTSVILHGECSDKLLYSIFNLSALTHLRISAMNERSVLFEASKELMFDEPSSSSSQLGVRSTFQSLRLIIEDCKFGRLFQGQSKRARGLTELTIYHCRELIISLEEFGYLNMNNSLQSLNFIDCPMLGDDFKPVLLSSIRARLAHREFRVDFT